MITIPSLARLQASAPYQVRSDKGMLMSRLFSVAPVKTGA
jgi:hypothetical protein